MKKLLAIIIFSACALAHAETLDANEYFNPQSDELKKYFANADAPDVRDAEFDELKLVAIHQTPTTPDSDDIAYAVSSVLVIVAPDYAEENAVMEFAKLYPAGWASRGIEHPLTAFSTLRKSDFKAYLEQLELYIKSTRRN